MSRITDFFDSRAVLAISFLLVKTLVGTGMPRSTAAYVGKLDTGADTVGDGTMHNLAIVQEPGRVTYHLLEALTYNFLLTAFQRRLRVSNPRDGLQSAQLYTISYCRRTITSDLPLAWSSDMRASSLDCSSMLSETLNPSRRSSIGAANEVEDMNESLFSSCGN